MIQVENGAKLQVPDGLSQSQIGEVVDHYMSSATNTPTPSAPDNRFMGGIPADTIDQMKAGASDLMDLAAPLNPLDPRTTGDVYPSNNSLPAVQNLQQDINKDSYNRQDVEKAALAAGFNNPAGKLLGAARIVPPIAAISALFNKAVPPVTKATGLNPEDLQIAAMVAPLVAKAAAHANILDKFGIPEHNIDGNEPPPPGSPPVGNTNEVLQNVDNNISSDNNSLPESVGASVLDSNDSISGNQNATGNIPGQEIEQPEPPVLSKTPIKDFLDKQLTPQIAQESLQRIDALAQRGINAPIGIAATSPTLLALARNRAITIEGAPLADATFGEITQALSKNDAKFINDLADTSQTVTNDVDTFQTAAQSIKQNLIDARKAKATPIYKAVVDQPVPADIAQNLIDENPHIQATISKVATDPTIQTLFKNVPANSVGMWDQVKQALDSQISQAQRTGAKVDVKTLTDAKNNLTNTIDDIYPQYKEARMAFASDSEVIDNIFGEKPNSPLNRIVKFADHEPTKVINSVFSLQPDQILEMRNNFEKLGQTKAFDSITRAFLTNLMQKKPTGSDLSDVLRNPLIENRLNAAISDVPKLDALNDLMDAHDWLDSNLKGINPQQGARTASELNYNEEVRQATQNMAGRSLKLGADLWGHVRGLWEADVDELQKYTERPEYLHELLKTLFDPQAGREYLKDYLSRSEPQKADALAGIVSQTIKNLKAGFSAAMKTDNPQGGFIDYSRTKNLDKKIPINYETLDKTGNKVESELIKMGVPAEHIEREGSRISESEYIRIHNPDTGNELKLRMSGHDLPHYYNQADMNLGLVNQNSMGLSLYPEFLIKALNTFPEWNLKPTKNMEAYTKKVLEPAEFKERQKKMATDARNLEWNNRVEASLKNVNNLPQDVVDRIMAASNKNQNQKVRALAQLHGVNASSIFELKDWIKNHYNGVKQ